MQIHHFRLAGVGRHFFCAPWFGHEESRRPTVAEGRPAVPRHALLVACCVGVVAVFLSGLAAAAGCMEGAKDRDALIQCAKSELVPLENRAAAAQMALLERHARDTSTLGRLRESKRTWDSSRTAQCALESRLKSAATVGEEAALEAERAMMVCIRREFARRVEDLDALVSASPAKKSP